jgi:hypothetical protein
VFRPTVSFLREKEVKIYIKIIQSSEKEGILRQVKFKNKRNICFTVCIIKARTEHVRSQDFRK